jgi:uncharacterized protein HemX
MIDIQPPPVSDTRGVLPWLFSVVLAIGAALWAAFRSKDAKLVGALEARIEEQAKQYAKLKETSDATITKLGEKLDKEREEARVELEEERKARMEDQRRMTKILLQMRGAGRERPEEWKEAPTGIRNLLEIFEPSDDPRRDPDSSTPPPPKRPPRPR